MPLMRLILKPSRDLYDLYGHEAKKVHCAKILLIIAGITAAATILLIYGKVVSVRLEAAAPTVVALLLAFLVRY